MDHSTRGQRVTALVSTLVAVALLGAAVTAEQAGPAHSGQLNHLESDLRYQLALAFRGDGGALNQRLAALEATLTAWRSSPQSPADEQLLAAWYRESIQRSMPGRAAELPAPPEFGAVAAPAPSAAAPRSGGPRAPVAQPAVPDAAAAPEPTTAPALAPRTSADESLPAPEEAPADVVLQVSEPLTPAAPNPSAGPTITDMPRVIVSLKPVPEAPLVAVEPLEAPLEEGGGSPAPAVASGSPSEGPAPAPAATGTTTARPAPAPPLDAPVGEHSITVQRTTAPAPHATSYAEGAGPPAPTPAEVRINLDELNARIGGYDQALIDIEAALVARPRLTPDELSAVVTRIEQLAGQYSLVRLYYDALTAEEQQRVGTLRDMGGTIDLVTRHAARQEAETDLLSDFDAASDQPTALERLRRLADAVRTAEPADR